LPRTRFSGVLGQALCGDRPYSVPMTILRNVRLVGDGGPAQPVDVEFDAAITSIRPAAEPAPQAAKTLLPGLIDTHVHLGERSRLVDALRSGLTSVVDLGTHPDSLVDQLRADDELPAIVSAGSAASAPGSTQIEMMGFPAESGVDVLTHTPFDRPLPEATLNRLRESGTVVSPTLVMMRAIIDGRLADRADAAFGLALDNVRAMDEAGVTVIAGTDANETAFAPLHHGPSLHTELAYLVQAGMNRTEALRAATSAAADALGLRDRGRVVEGARADLLLVDGDPLTDLDALRSPAEVWVAGDRLAP